MKFEQAIFGVDRHKVATAGHTFDGHSLVMGWGFIDSTAGGANGVEHHNGRELV